MPEGRPILPGEPIKDLCAVGLLGPGGEPGWRESIGWDRSFSSTMYHGIPFCVNGNHSSLEG